MHNVALLHCGACAFKLTTSCSSMWPRLISCFLFFFLYSLSKNLVFMPVASAMTAVHLVLGSNARWSEIQHLLSQGQIISDDLL